MLCPNVKHTPKPSPRGTPNLHQGNTLDPDLSPLIPLTPLILKHPSDPMGTFTPCSRNPKHHPLGVPPRSHLGPPWWHSVFQLCPQVPSSDSEGLTYLELQAVTPSTQPTNSPIAPQPSVIYTEVAVRGCH